MYTSDMILTSKGQSISLGFGSKAKLVHSPDKMLPFLIYEVKYIQKGCHLIKLVLILFNFI